MMTKKAIDKAYRNIHKFHKLQYPVAIKSETTQGVFCESYSPISSVGLYIPSGTAALFSNVLMLAIPAKIGGCKNIVISSPQRGRDRPHDNLLRTALRSGQYN